MIQTLDELIAEADGVSRLGCKRPGSVEHLLIILDGCSYDELTIGA